MKDRIGEWDEEWLAEEWRDSIPREYRSKGALVEAFWPKLCGTTSGVIVSYDHAWTRGRELREAA